MKKLKRLLLIHWHHYQKEIIEFEDINFLTGKTATGKSTIIDALQLVLLGETNGSFFNKAANDKSTRTLKSYLFCEEGDDGAAGFRYLRNQRFTSYVAVEFEDTERKVLFTCGIVCDCYTDGTYDSKWFLLNNSGFPENEFIDPKTKVPYDINGLKAFLRNNNSKKKSDFEFFETNKRYQEVTLGKFGQMKQKYRTLLKKAVPFTPITDIEQFITESICDVRNNIDVEKMQSDIRQYKNLEDDAERIRERIELLQKIDGFNKEYVREKEVYLTQSYIIAKANIDEKIQEKNNLEKQLEQKQEELAKCESDIAEIAELLKKVSDLRGDKDAEYRNSDVLAKEKLLKSEIYDLEAEIEQITDGVIKATTKLQGYARNWHEHISQPGLKELADIRMLKGYLHNLMKINVTSIVNLDFDECWQNFEKLREIVHAYAFELQKRVQQLEQDINALRLKIVNLEKGIKPYPEAVTALRKLLEKEIFVEFHKTVNLHPLADLLEIKNLQWQNAIEGYLATQKFYLMVPTEYYDFALRIYDSAKKEKGLFDVGIVNIAAVRKHYQGNIDKNSLAEEVESANSDALLYAKFILGKVIKCSEVTQLANHRIAITSSCMLYKNFVSRRINPARYESPFIGRRAMQQQLARCREELATLQEEKTNVDNIHIVAAKASKSPTLSQYEADSYKETIAAAEKIPGMQERQATLEIELGKLDLLYLERLQKEIEELRQQEYKYTQEKERLIENRGSIREQVRTISDVNLPEVAGLLTSFEKDIEENYAQDWRIKVGELRYRDALKEERTSKSLKTSFEQALKATASRRDKFRTRRTEQRSEYNTIYKMPFDVNKEDNDDFDKEYIALNDVQLPEYLEKIKDAKEKAYVQFKDDFIAKIKSNIETVGQQIDELNASLRQSVFGTDKYHFVKKPRPEYQRYYDMITDEMLMDTGGWNLTSEAFNDKYQKEINELFNMLIINETDVSAEKRAEYEKAIRKFTDYKTYLVFDLIVTNEQGVEQRLSKTILKKSGGETQIPFYIALLASFSQVCRIRNKNQNNTIRLIILDEAFSKMDGERIKESVPLLRKFGLQAIFSAPPDKIPDIAPLADRNIAVYKNGNYSFTRRFDPKNLVETEALTE